MLVVVGVVLVVLVTVEAVIYWVFEIDHYIEATEDFVFLCLCFYSATEFPFLHTLSSIYCL